MSVGFPGLVLRARQEEQARYTAFFSLIMMFGAPLLITGLVYFAFGGMSSGKSSFYLPVTKVVVANLDQPIAGAASTTSGTAAGMMLVDFLQDKSLAEILQVSMTADEAAARRAVDEQKAGVAIITRPTFPLPPYPRIKRPA